MSRQTYTVPLARHLAARAGLPARAVDPASATWPLTIRPRPEWEADARCSGDDPDRFAAASKDWGRTESGERVTDVLPTCNGDDTTGPCPARTDCLLYHLITEVCGRKPMAGTQRLTIAGGLTGRERAFVARLIEDTARARAVREELAVPA